MAFFISFNLELFLYFNISYQMISILFNFIEKKIMKYIFGLCYEEQPLEMRLQTMSLFCLHFISFVSCYRYTCSNVYNLNKMLVCIYTFRYMICVYEHAHHYHYIFFFYQLWSFNDPFCVLHSYVRDRIDTKVNRRLPSLVR